MASKPKQKFYAVIKGRKTGVFTSWFSCERQIKGYKGAIYKSYKTRSEAEAALANASVDPVTPVLQQDGEEPAPEPQILYSDDVIRPSLSVDASCLGNPGILEYRGVVVESREEIFCEGPFPNGTNNIGEFLAIVQGLMILTEQDQEIPIYSDSEIAILWVKKKKAKTTLVRSSRNDDLFDRIEAAQAWLEENTYPNPILKWNTRVWGEIPADFGRK